MDRLLLKITAITLGIFVSIVVSFGCAIIVGVMSFFDFWRALLLAIETPKPELNETKESVGVWERHIARLDEQNKKD